MGKLCDAAPLMHLTKAILLRWPAERPLEYLHAPLAAGENPPVLGSSFYRPLGGLRLPAETRFVAGFLHETRSLDELRQILSEIESTSADRLKGAASCGLARRRRAAAVTVMRQSAELCVF